MSHNTESFTLSQESQMVIKKRFKCKQNYLTATTFRGDGPSRCRTETNHMQGFFYILCHFNIIYQSSIYRNYHYQNQVIILIIISSALFCKISRCGLMREEIKWIFWSLPKMVSIGQSLSVVKRCCAPKIFLFFS